MLGGAERESFAVDIRAVELNEEKKMRGGLEGNKT
jgi:hypothetical protein